MPEPSSSGTPIPKAKQADAANKPHQQQQQQQQQKHSPSPSPRTGSAQPVPINPRGNHSPHAPRSPSLAYHSSSAQQQQAPSASSSPHRLPRPQNTAELHQELEREQEGVVNRLLHMIRSASQSSLPPQSPPANATSHPGLPVRQTSFTSEDGRRHSRQNSDASDLWMVGGGMGGRDEAAFYRTEAEMLARENEMLRRRIRELEEMATKGGKGGNKDDVKKDENKKVTAAATAAAATTTAGEDKKKGST